MKSLQNKFLQSREALNNYICESGVVKLIERYAEPLIHELLQMAHNIKKKPQHSDLILMKDSNKYMSFSVSVYILTNNSFLIFKSVSAYKDNDKLHKIKFSKNNKKKYVQIFKESINLPTKKFNKKFKQMLKTTKTIPVSISDIYTELKKYENELYNIKIRKRDYFYNENVEAILNSDCTNITDVIPKKHKQKIICTYYNNEDYMSINTNIQNLIN
jgi:hypothetical protein